MCSWGESSLKWLSLFFSIRWDSFEKSPSSPSTLYFLREGSFTSSLGLLLPLLVRLVLFIIWGVFRRLAFSLGTPSLFCPYVSVDLRELIDFALVFRFTRWTRLTQRYFVSGTIMVCISTSASFILRSDEIFKFFLHISMILSAVILFLGSISSILWTTSFKDEE